MGHHQCPFMLRSSLPPYSPPHCLLCSAPFPSPGQRLAYDPSPGHGWHRGRKVSTDLGPALLRDWGRETLPPPYYYWDPLNGKGLILRTSTCQAHALPRLSVTTPSLKHPSLVHISFCISHDRSIETKNMRDRSMHDDVRTLDCTLC